ncbi:MAG: cellulase family glycosylhydrolase [Bacteroidia bacterium]|nr:cellulase family glycosylhydrolase [Bacteroidia bacterium]
MKRIIVAILAVCGCMLLASCTSKQTENEGFVIKRGTNLSHWLSQSVDRGEARAARVTEADIARLAEAGFDHVRIPIDEVQFWDEEGNKLPEAWDLLTGALDNCRKYGLRAIVDLHIIRSHNFNAGFEGKKNTLFTDEAAQDGIINMWYQLSDALKDYSTDWVAYEFMNEPVADEHEQWNRLVAKVHKALREREPERTLVVGSNLWQGVGTMKYLKVPEGDKNIILSCHFYEPMALTHYTAPWTESGQYYGPVTYPGVMIPEEEFAKLDEHHQEIFRQYTTEWNRDRLESMFKDAFEAAERMGLQLYCGEWGVFQQAPAESKYNWYRDMISIFDQYDVAWSTWCYFDEFGFWSLENQEISDPELLSVLTSGKALGE